jgi:DNA-binding GntR family transcriptional regulator
MTASALSGLEHSQLKDRVYHYLREAIISGTFEVGAALRENDITARLGVSKTPVREAFVRLEKDRLLVLVPYKGAVVAGYSTEDLREFYEVRELLEGACARMAAETVTDRLREDLQRNITRSVEASDAEKFDAVVRLFDEFDEIIYRQSTNRWIDELVENLDGHQRRIGRLTLDIPGRITRSVKQHRTIASAISKGDGEAAERSMRAHVHSVMTDQLKAVKAS